MPLGSLHELAQMLEDAFNALLLVLCVLLALGWLKVVDGELHRASTSHAREKRRVRYARARSLTWPE